MPILSGHEIIDRIHQEDILIEPFNESQLNPNSFNLRLGDRYLTYDEEILDPKKKNKTILQPTEIFSRMHNLANSQSN